MATLQHNVYSERPRLHAGHHRLDPDNLIDDRSPHQQPLVAIHGERLDLGQLALLGDQSGLLTEPVLRPTESFQVSATPSDIDLGPGKALAEAVRQAVHR